MEFMSSGSKYPLKFLLVVHIVYSLAPRSNSEDKNARKKILIGKP